MGGGDLNLKKSWHPSTMKNMEKVWKAEQAHKQEQHRIAELQRELREEREREEIQKFAEDQGVVEKGNGSKLDWMYKGPVSLVNREEYLLGRAVDKTFEQLEHEEKKLENCQLVASTSNAVEYDCIPASIFSAGGSEQVDLARKIQEDPLFQIRKKEEESRRNILDNPVKMKQLQMMMKDVQKERKRKKKDKKKRTKKQHSDSDSTDDSGRDLSSSKQLDRLLAKKYSNLKNKLSKEDLKELGRFKEDRIKVSHRNERQHKNKGKMEYAERKSRKHNSSSEDERRRKHRDSSHNKREGQLEGSQDYRRLSHSPDHQRSSQHLISRTIMREKFDKSSQRRKMDEKEIEKKRQEMMQNAKWRDEQRKKNVERYKEEDKRETEKHSKQHDTEFIRKHLAAAATYGSVEKRIKSNVYNIQRSGFSMDKNFARR